ncbi:MAG: type II toxin-antitoxin system HicA family toxin [Defluviitaleaceae bacterium]|nr:type II toxin-antitoxin system HicA family toxin [Defluviitaleaceae bacterium]
MKISEFVRGLKKQGIKFHSHGTRHDWYINPENGKMAQIPRHKTQELRPGTMGDILKSLGLKG